MGAPNVSGDPRDFLKSVLAENRAASLRAKRADALAVVLLFVPTLLWEAFVLARLWLWFVVPLGLPKLGVVQVAGIDFIATLCKYSAAKKAEVKPGEFPGLLVMRAGVFLFGFVVCWLLHRFAS
jgi:hypothetical protein